MNFKSIVLSPVVLSSAAVMAQNTAKPAVAKAASAAMKPNAIKFTEYDLPNGLHVILHEDHSTPIVAVTVLYHVGSAREKPGRTGFAHLFEHLMFTGSGHVEEGECDALLEAA